MVSALERTSSPEERELARYLLTIEAKKRQVADTQTELESLRDDLARFNAEYHARVGVWLTEAARLEREADEFRYRAQLAQEEPSLSEEEILQRVEQRFHQERARQEEEEQRSRRFRDQARSFREQPHLDHDNAARLKRLFKDLAKRFHPDLARSDDERIERTRRMQDVTNAFHRRDIAAMERLALSQEIDSTAFDRLSIAEKLVWAIREVARLDDLLHSLEREIQEFTQTAMYRLLEQQQLGQDPLAVLEAEAKRKRAIAQAKLDEAKREYERVA